MKMLFWSRRKTDKSKPKDTAKAGQKTSSEAVRQQALRTMRAASAEIGEDTLQKIAAAIHKKERSAMERARNQIQSLDKDRIVDNLRYLLDER